MGVMKNRVDRDAERRVAGVAVMPLLALDASHSVGRAVGAGDPTLPADVFNVGEAGSSVGNCL